ncbi:hypothetical protein D9758_010741 [Tetrapyrgos nigripes]|uniref:Uncharacterized protein n=1 Tax=Tetrapyrgos nigripes TaxID=182062 RepID=A0A8H5D6I0_9AGAR|nr:hypothetical protein D9758_010741 [Tetrapyrgos nigripes]
MVSFPCDSLATQPSAFASEPRSYRLLWPGKNSLSPRVVATLEYNWGVPRGGIDFNASHNKLSVRKDIAALLGKEKLCFVPTPQTLQEMVRIHKSDARPHQPYTESFPVRPYEYILATGSFKGPLYVRDPVTKKEQCFEYPYDGLPTFTSSVHPFHAAYHSSGCILLYHKRLQELYDWGAFVIQGLMDLIPDWISPELLGDESEEASSSSEPCPLTPPRGVKSAPAYDCADGYMDDQSIAAWIAGTQVPGYAEDPVFDSPRRIREYEESPLSPRSYNENHHNSVPISLR